MAFPFFLKLSANWKPNSHREYYNLLKYMMRCSALFPEECLQFICRTTKVYRICQPLDNRRGTYPAFDNDIQITKVE